MYHKLVDLCDNPPYDTAIQAIHTDDKRLEHQFLRSYSRTLQIGGILVFVIPYYVLKHCAKTLARNFKVQVVGFPDEEFPVFKQCVVFGEKRYMSEEKMEKNKRIFLAFIIGSFALGIFPIIEFFLAQHGLLV